MHKDLECISSACTRDVSTTGQVSQIFRCGRAASLGPCSCTCCLDAYPCRLLFSRRWRGLSNSTWSGKRFAVLVLVACLMTRRKIKHLHRLTHASGVLTPPYHTLCYLPRAHLVWYFAALVKNTLIPSNGVMGACACFQSNFWMRRLVWYLLISAASISWLCFQGSCQKANRVD